MKSAFLPGLFQALLALVQPHAAASAENVQPPLLWRDGATLDIEGRGFPGKTDSPYVRIPEKWKDAIPEGVWRNSRTSMGMCVRFVTRSAVVGIRWGAVALPPAHPQMAPGGQTGIDVYRRAPGGDWTHCRMATPPSPSAAKPSPSTASGSAPTTNRASPASRQPPTPPARFLAPSPHPPKTARHSAA